MLFVVSVCSLFIGVMDADLASLMQGDPEVIRLFLISRIPRLLAILCTGIGMSTAGLIMQQLCMNKFVSPTTGATIGPAWNFAGSGISPGVYTSWKSSVCVCGGDSGNLDFCVVCSENPF